MPWERLTVAVVRASAIAAATGLLCWLPRVFHSRRGACASERHRVGRERGAPRGVEHVVAIAAP